MDDNLSITTEKSSFPKILGLMVPAFLLLTKDKDMDTDIKKFILDKDYGKQVQMMNGIKEYFPENHQLVLSKIQDILDVLTKINRIRLDRYDGVIQSQSILPSIDKRERILSEMSKYSEGKNKELIDKVVDTKRNLYRTKENIERHRELVQSQSVNALESIIMFMNCFKPILREDMNKKIKKVEKVVELLATPHDLI